MSGDGVDLKVKEDFYIERRGLAAYFEKEWFDKVLYSPVRKEPLFEFPKFHPGRLHSDYHEKFVEFLARALDAAGVEPVRMLEVGSALGRTYYELCIRFESLRTAILVEPSRNLAACFRRIFEADSVGSFPVLLGNSGLTEVELNSTDIRAACSKVAYELVNLPYESLWGERARYDLVVCSNVIDQCRGPRALVEFLKSRVEPGGTLALSCTYQWNSKYVDSSEILISNIDDLFEGGWRHLGGANLEFRCRKHERCWNTFLSHVSIFQSPA